ncbi:MAG TPA: GtrA family protein [Rhizomicrobium sp.]|nr:GtrA family protein [Rhizomicrobium sp.]
MRLAKRAATSRFLRFAFVGACGFFVNEAALWLALRILHLGPYWGGLFSFFVAVTFTWWGNRALTFREGAARGMVAIFAEWMRFVAANGLGFAVNYAIYASLVGFAPAPANNPFLALACGTIAGLAVNFAASSRFVFRGARSAQSR